MKFLQTNLYYTFDPNLNTVYSVDITDIFNTNDVDCIQMTLLQFNEYFKTRISHKYNPQKIFQLKPSESLDQQNYILHPVLEN